MKDEGLLWPKGEIGNEVTQKQHAGPRSGSKGQNKHKWGQDKSGPHDDKEKSLGKELVVQKVKRDFTKFKCFYCDNHKHLVKDCPKPPLVNDCISQGKMIIQRGFMAKIGAHKSKASNLLKLKCEMNNELVCCFLDS